ncbi:MAG TPA: glucosaminidase domain-containing protein [Actinomycetota bacterium]|nr:glucosaminidase domain-containing protein [Actinomycetota bacterium]
MSVTTSARLVAPPRADVTQAQRYVTSKAHGTYSDDEVRQIVELYFETGKSVGLDPLLAVSQMVLETGNLTSFWSQPPRRNPAGIGVTGEPGAGISFPSWTAAVRAHVGRLLAYAIAQSRGTNEQVLLIKEALSWRPLPSQLRGAAPSVKDLARTWAADPAYAPKISRIANEILAMAPGPGMKEEDDFVDVVTFGVQSADPTIAGMWLLAGDGKAHHVPTPEDLAALGNVVKHLGDMSEEFLRRFERIHPALENLP